VAGIVNERDLGGRGEGQGIGGTPQMKITNRSPGFMPSIALLAEEKQRGKEETQHNRGELRYREGGEMEKSAIIYLSRTLVGPSRSVRKGV